MKRRLKYPINDDNWTFCILSEDDYTKKHSDLKDSVANVSYEVYQVDFKENSFNLKTIYHELTHIHFKYCFTNSTKISQDDMEEIFCELFANRGEKMIKQAKDIYKRLKK